MKIIHQLVLCCCFLLLAQCAVQLKNAKNDQIPWPFSICQLTNDWALYALYLDKIPVIGQENNIILNGVARQAFTLEYVNLTITQDQQVIKQETQKFSEDFQVSDPVNIVIKIPEVTEEGSFKLTITLFSLLEHEGCIQIKFTLTNNLS